MVESDVDGLKVAGFDSEGEEAGPGMSVVASDVDGPKIAVLD